MATYNGEEHIREQLDSISRQDLLPFELVITDDGSTDATLQRVDDFARAAPFPVRVFRNEARLGYADNFLKAASLCQGDLIAFCDQDDIWMEKKLQVCCRFFADAEVVLAIHAAQLISEAGERGLRFPHFRRTRQLDIQSCNPFANMPGFAMMVRRSLLDITDRHQRPRRIFSHDHWLWFVAASSGKIAIIADTLTLYRQHGSNVFGARQPRSLGRRARSIAATTEYEESADFELACARELSVAAEQIPRRADCLRLSAKRLELRSKFHRMRSRIYKRESTLMGRAAAFFKIFALGGYLPDESRTRLGLRAAAKDMLFGVPGTYRILNRRADLLQNR
jgi:glycosyltransferase involved in cell wall biosynthesis